MPIKVTGLITAYAFFHNHTWDYLCRNCLKEGKAVKMETFKKDGKIWVKCPKCKSDPEKLSTILK